MPRLKVATAPKQRAELVTDPQATDRLMTAFDVVLAASDRVSAAIAHFNKLDPATDPPAAWVGRAVDLHVALLEAWWALDDQAALDAAAGGWTVGPPHAIGTAVERRLTRVRWETELMRPPAPALWWDRLVVAVKAATTEERIEEAGRSLVREASRRRYAGWHETTRREATE